MPGRFAVKTRWTFYQLLALGGSFLLLLLLIGWQIYPALFLFIKSLGSSLSVVCGCSTALSFTANPWLTSLVLLAGLVVSLLLLYGIFSAFKVWWQTRRFVRRHLGFHQRLLSAKISPLVRHLGLENLVYEIESSQPVIFCFGLLRPKICLASNLVQRLQKRELLAVLKHESYHLKNHEPLKLFLISVIEHLLFFLPGLKALVQHYKTIAEITADEYATANFADKAPLARALYKVLKLTESAKLQNNLSLSFFGLVTEERIQQLSQANPAVKWRLGWAKINLGIFSLLFVGLTALLVLVFQDPALAGETPGGICQGDKLLAPSQCQLMAVATCQQADRQMSYQINSGWCVYATGDN